MIDPKVPGGHAPDWYLAMRACKWAGEPFCAAHGIAWSPIVEGWALIAESAEHEAEAELHKRAHKAAQKGR